jgi:branched-chain amino acid transport system ATP-binding protein
VTETLLTLEGVQAHYGHIAALKGVDLGVNRGEIVALIGANGAGKSTLLMTICGVLRASGGRIAFDGEDITHLPTFQVVRRGVIQAPEGRRIFPRLTVLENLQVGAIAAPPERYQEDLARVYELFPVLAQRRHQRGGTLSGGEQQMLAIARALMARPRVLLLDEPSLGLAPLLIQQIFRVIGEINAQGTTVLLVEQNAYHALKLAHRGYVLVAGHVTLQGRGTELLENPEVRAAYLEGGRSAGAGRRGDHPGAGA